MHLIIKLQLLILKILECYNIYVNEDLQLRGFPVKCIHQFMNIMQVPFYNLQV